MPDRPDPAEADLHKTIVENLSDGIYMVDRERQITYWNRGAERISGYSSAEVVGRHCFDNILGHVDAAGNSLCHSACPLAQTMSDGDAREVSIWLKHADGQLGLKDAGPFDAIVMAAAATQIPESLREQLAPGGRMVLPLGTRQQHLTLVERTPEGFTQTTLDPVRFVPLLPGAVV